MEKEVLYTTSYVLFAFLTNQTYLPTNLSESGKLTLGEAAEISFEYINYL